MSNALIKPRTEADGRTAYVVADHIVVYDEQEAIDLTQTGVFQVRDVLALLVIERDKARGY